MRGSSGKMKINGELWLLTDLYSENVLWEKKRMKFTL